MTATQRDRAPQSFACSRDQQYAHFAPIISAMTSRLLGIALAVLANIAAAQSSGRVVVPYPPGGSLDAMARVVAGKLSEATEIGRAHV